jgi:transcriptional regulator with XRE-family HTH domain
VNLSSTEIQRRVEVGALLRRLRQEKGLTGQQLADRMGISRPYVTHWESGRRSLNSLLHVQRLLDVLDPDPESRQQLLRLLDLNEFALGFADMANLDLPALADQLDCTLRELVKLDGQMERLGLARAALVLDMQRLTRAIRIRAVGDVMSEV